MAEPTTTLPAMDLLHLAREFAADIGGNAERSKKNLASPPGFQIFLLYIRAEGKVPPHQVAGPITVQTIVGNANFSFGGNTYPLPVGSVISVADSVPHELAAHSDSVLLVTRALPA